MYAEYFDQAIVHNIIALSTAEVVIRRNWETYSPTER